MEREEKSPLEVWGFIESMRHMDSYMEGVGKVIYS